MDSVRCAIVVAALGAAGCSSPILVDVQLVDPCNQDAIATVDFLRFEPRGATIDSEGLTTVQRVDDAAAQPIPIPLSSDFQLVVTGHRDSFNSPAAGIGVSGKYNLETASDAVSIRVPFALIDDFYKTTDLATDTCTALSEPRFGATATYLPASGQVLIVGGITEGHGAPKFRRAIEMYNPATGTFANVAELKAGGARAFHTATLLNDGRVLIAGGAAEVGVSVESLRSALIIDPTDPTKVKLSDVITLRKARSGHTAVSLADGRVILIGGRERVMTASRPEDHNYLRSIEVFDPTKNLFAIPADATGVNAVELGFARFGHTSTLLADGKNILVAGGFSDQGPERSLEVVGIEGEMVHVVTASTARTGVGPIFSSAALAEDGRVLLAGGYAETLNADPDGLTPRMSTAAVEMWEYREGQRLIQQTCSDSMVQARGHFTVDMVGRRALFIGGYGDAGAPLKTGEIVTLTEGNRCFATNPKSVDLADARARHVTVPLLSGEVLIVGGIESSGMSQTGQSMISAEVFSPARAP